MVELERSAGVRLGSLSKELEEFNGIVGEEEISMIDCVEPMTQRR